MQSRSPTGTTPSPPALGHPPARTGSLPPPPPSARPVSERPTPPGASSLPPPLSLRPRLPSAPAAPSFRPLAPKTDQNIPGLEAEISRLRTRLTEEREATRTEKKNADLLRAELSRVKQQVIPASPPALDTRLALEKQAETYERKLRDLRQAHQGELSRLTREHAARSETLRVAHVEQMKTLERQVTAGQADGLKEATSRVHLLEEQLKTLRQNNIALRQRAEELAHTAPTLSGQESQDQDDLTVLKGIGPKFASALRRAGVTSIAQIAQWNESDIERIAPKLKLSAARIHSYGWVQNAKDKLEDGLSAGELSADLSE